MCLVFYKSRGLKASDLKSTFKLCRNISYLNVRNHSPKDGHEETSPGALDWSTSAISFLSLFWISSPISVALKMCNFLSGRVFFKKNEKKWISTYEFSQNFLHINFLKNVLNPFFNFIIVKTNLFLLTNNNHKIINFQPFSYMTVHMTKHYGSKSKHSMVHQS